MFLPPMEDAALAFAELGSDRVMCMPVVGGGGVFKRRLRHYSVALSIAQLSCVRRGIFSEMSWLSF